MIIRITTTGFTMSEELDKYARRKVESLERYVPRKDRTTTLVEVGLSEKSGKKTPLRSCELRIKLRRSELVATEVTQHLYASLDVAAADIEQQLKQYRQQNPSVLQTAVRKASTRARTLRRK